MNTNEAISNNQSSDWHPADVKAALEKRGWSLSRLSLAAGFSRYAVGKALHKPWPLTECVIAHVLECDPWDIWPSRYTNGVHNTGRSGLSGAKWHSIKARLEFNATRERGC
ncbi:helix-turn-helix domain-containing protein [Marinobacterium litorale]|uniref:helix-turn-helix domain-containing protein n=1 Tax=Marinobacterium litorale TaxID=404770 RepID=UPI000A06CD81